MLRTCHHCKAQFNTENKTANFCSNDCAKIWIDNLPRVECKFCKADFPQRTKNQEFCSKECIDKNTNTNKSLLEKVCGQCKMKFVAQTQAAIFCSRRCKNNSYNSSKPRVLKIKNCAHCNKPFQPSNEAQRFDTAECKKLATSIKNCRQCNKEFASIKATFCSDACTKLWVDISNAKKALEKTAIKTPNLPKEIDNKEAIKALEKILSAIDATGGLFIDQKGLYSLVMDEEAFGIAAAYTNACNVLARPKRVETDPRLLNDCRTCGTLTSLTVENACGCKSPYCNHCKAYARLENCQRHNQPNVVSITTAKKKALDEASAS